MKKSILSVRTYISIFLTMIAISSYASIESCPPYVVHCTYITGLSSKLEDGRYIKISHSTITNIICFNGASTAFIDEWGAASHIGNNSDVYHICSDSSGKKCEKIGIDNFTITKNGDYRYSAKPKYFNLDLSALKEKYPACNSIGLIKM